MIATTGRLDPFSRMACARPTAAGTPQPNPPLPLAKNDSGSVLGSHWACWPIVEGDSLPKTPPGGRTSLTAAYTSPGVNGELGLAGSARAHANGFGVLQLASVSPRSINVCSARAGSPTALSPTIAAAAVAGLTVT